MISLAFPVVTKSGQRITEIPIRKGQNINISICAYNRVPEIWGPNAHEWYPQRFLHMDKSKQTGIGLYANLLNFCESYGIMTFFKSLTPFNKAEGELWRFSLVSSLVLEPA
ncbi:hypothetical protein EWM64_g4496 [Hericium alpestre]|uniref:Uncharacterized protein n=1 Tax=Hericium alpestre TaxID=135208 RepID=A0A4Y9ZZN8_9AGAM|nr:hypothetical protein EWM64_g4496 [Hericium alpestre]